MKIRHILAILIVAFGFGAVGVFYSASHYERFVEGEVQVSSAQIVTVTNYDQLLEGATENGSSPQPGPVVLKLGSPLPFTVQIGDQILRGEEVTNSFGAPNSYLLITSLEDERIIVTEGGEIALVVYADEVGELRIEPDMKQMEWWLAVAYCVSFALIGLGLYVAVTDDWN